MSDASAPADPGPERPAHVEENTRTLAGLHDEHYGRLPPLGRALDEITAVAGKPAFVIGLLIVSLAWVAINLVLKATGRRPPDPPPFGYLQALGTVFAVVMTCLILSTQRRENQLATRRDQLTLELCLLTEQKTSKTIELLEALRRDSPILGDRADASAGAFSTPSDPRVILEAIQDARPDLQSR